MADDREESGGDIGASELDELTHAELLMLYQDSTVSVRFARERQWKLVGAALLLDTAVVAIPQLVDVSTFAAKLLVLASFLIGASVIYILIVYQVWQNAELRRMQTIGSRFSSVFAELGGRNAAREGKLHGYIILFFMIAAIGLGNALAVLLLSRFYL
ncbi:MAG: hypothetical protein IH786_11020 [Proteobacteria bacterium]|nr:hypothetical protein [Pseudomonadota bacterium]